MIKYIKTFCFFAAGLSVILTFMACNDEDGHNMSDIVIGREAPLKEAAISPAATRNILLGGGNGKYTAFVENPQIATVAVVGDTLKVTGVYEGKTFAIIRSHNLTSRLDINVVPPSMSFSQNFIRLYPKDQSTSITLTGGGIVNLKTEDPDNILDVKWRASNHVVELRPFCEGEATITAIGQDGSTDKLRVKVQCEGTIDRVGYYSTRSHYITTELNTRMMVNNRKQGVSLFGTTNPKTGYGVRLSPIVNPVAGQTYKLVATKLGQWDNNRVQSGEQMLLVEEVRKDKGLVLLRGRGFKYLVPYHKQ